MNSEERKQDLDLPFAQIERIMKNALTLEKLPQPKKKQQTKEEGSQRFESDVSSISESSSSSLKDENFSQQYYSPRNYASDSAFPTKISKEAKETM